MKKIVLLAILIVAALGAWAQTPTAADRLYMDMAVTAAAKSKADGGKADGAVIILNRAFKASGIPGNGMTAEQNAVAKSRLKDLANATVYTVNEPVTAVINLLSRLGAKEVVYVNPRTATVAAGINTSSEYNDSELDTTTPRVPMRRINWPEASALLK